MFEPHISGFRQWKDICFPDHVSQALAPVAATQELALVHINRGTAGVPSGDGNLLYYFYPKIYMAHRCWVVFVCLFVFWSCLLACFQFYPSRWFTGSRGMSFFNGNVHCYLETTTNSQGRGQGSHLCTGSLGSMSKFSYQNGLG